MIYNHRLATQSDIPTLAHLWHNFCLERVVTDPSMQLKPDFDFEHYIQQQLEDPLTRCLVLDHLPEEQTEPGNGTWQQRSTQVVGCLLFYFYDEAPSPHTDPETAQALARNNPFSARRIVSVLGLYVQPNHRDPGAIQSMVEAAIALAKDQKITDIDLLIAADQTGIHALLRRLGFTQAAFQFSKHYTLPDDQNLPSLHPPQTTAETYPLPIPDAIPLRDPKTQTLSYSPTGDPVFLYPLKDHRGKLLKTATGQPIYPPPVQDPQTKSWLFDAQGDLVVCPVLQDETEQVVEFQQIPQFHPIAYQQTQGHLQPKQDDHGRYVFCPVERDRNGHILRSPEGRPLFQSPLAS